MARRDEQRVDFRTGLAVVGIGGSLILGLFFLGQSDPWREDAVVIHADFKSIAGLSENHTVFLDGKKVGSVSDLDFVDPDYPCQVETEDLGRAPARTDDCEPSLFCITRGASAGRCGGLQPYTGDDADYAERYCTIDDHCGDTEVCINDDFRRRYPYVSWIGPRFTCVPYDARVQRIRVSMQIDANKLQFVREDSRATVASSGLGEKLVNITSGTGAPVEAGGRIQSGPSLSEELDMLGERFASITNEVDRSISGFGEVFDQLNSRGREPLDPVELREEITEVNVLLGEIERGEGQLGIYFNDPKVRDDFPKQLEDFRAAADELDRQVRKFERDTVPKIRTVRQASGKIIAFVDGLQDPAEHDIVSRMLADPIMGDDFKARVSTLAESIEGTTPKIIEVRVDVARLRSQMNRGEGPLGLLKNPKIYDELLKLFGNLERSESLRELSRVVIAEDDAIVILDVEGDETSP
jgi:hypothetical protein